ncbi:MAG: HAMP domain-containing methyl-accepting chemotaxis protein [Erythrobacter sp.]
MTIQRASRIGSIAILALILLASIVSAFAINKIRYGGDLHQKNIQLHDFRADILPPPAYLVEPFMEANLLASYPSETDEHIAMLNKQREAFLDRNSHWEKSDLRADLQTGLEATAQKDGVAFWREIDERLIPAVKSNNEEAIRASMNRLLEIYRSHRTAIDSLVEGSEEAQGELEASSSSTIWFTTAILFIALTTIVGAIFYGVHWLNRNALAPLSETGLTMQQLAAGNVEAGRTDVHRDDEIGTMTRSIEVFRQSLITDLDRAESQKHVVETLSGALDRLAEGDLTYRIGDSFKGEDKKIAESFDASAGKLSSMIGAVHASASSVKTGSDEIREASDDLATRNEQQSASLEESASSMNEVTELVKKSADNARAAQTAMSDTHKQAEDGGEVVKKAVDAMASIEKSSEEITQIIDVIDGIAFQTNLLALNAGVEAARAGEAGKGFAVVANEVRALAQRSAEAARDIKQLISNSTAQVGEGVNLVGETGTLLEAIVGQIGKVAGQVNEIASMSASQANNLDQVSQSVSTMDQMTQQNAAMVEQSTAASRNLSDEAGRLSVLVKQFRTSGDASSVGDFGAQFEAKSAPFRGHTPPRTQPSTSYPASNGNLALAPNIDDQDWSEF